MKCDEARPTCSACKIAGLSCGGYEKNIFFDFEDSSVAGAARVRRPLLTVKERQSMSEWLVSKVGPRSATWSITQIDEECEGAPASQDIQICHGPFGAFRQVLRKVDLHVDPIPELPDDISPPEDEVSPEEEYPCPADVPSASTPRTQEFVQGIFDLFDQNLPSSMMDLNDFADGLGHIDESFLDLTAEDIRQRQKSPMNALVPQDFQFPDFIPEHSYHDSIPHDIIPNSPTLESNVPHDAVFLLKHYSTVVLRSLSPFRHSKTPWHILFIPHAKSCLAALTLGEQLDHADLCLFFGTLAIGAFSLGGISQSEMWLEQGKFYGEQANKQMRRMLNTAYDFPKTAKYKSILMAILTMVHISMFAGNQKQTERHLLEAEKFIRVKGLGREKSRKVRLLHHCYAYERMFHESTFLDGFDSSYRHHVRKAIESSGTAAYSRDGLCFSLSHWENLEQEMRRVKGREESENDLHLQLPGSWSQTLYPEIFGVPEAYLLLLSLVIRLGREKESADRGGSNTLPLKDFVRRAKALEVCISRVKQLSADSCSKVQQQCPQGVLDNMLDAMQHSLAIYFYRRIYDLDASLLHHKVVAVRDCLLGFESADPANIHGSAILMWPAFIAACEAEDPELQASFSSWFQGCAQRSGLRSFNSTMTKIERCWMEKKHADGRNVAWLDLMKDV